MHCSIPLIYNPAFANAKNCLKVNALKRPRLFAAIGKSSFKTKFFNLKAVCP